MNKDLLKQYVEICEQIEKLQINYKKVLTYNDKRVTI